jgi:hypothetical protein
MYCCLLFNGNFAMFAAQPELEVRMPEDKNISFQILLKS